LLTNDGDFTYRLTHPKHDVSKTYQILLEGSLREADLAIWRQGIDLQGRLTRPAQVEVLNRHSTQQTLLRVVLWEGRNRQIRRVAQALGHRVLSLLRTAIGPIDLGQLPPGECRPLSSTEVAALWAESNQSSTDRGDSFLNPGLIHVLLSEPPCMKTKEAIDPIPFTGATLGPGYFAAQCPHPAGLSLEAVASKTLIRASLLQAIEHGDLDSLPEPVYIRGLIRRYGDALGLDGEALAIQFFTPPKIRHRSWERIPGCPAASPAPLWRLFFSAAGGH
jgi:pseudouridine synthase